LEPDCHSFGIEKIPRMFLIDRKGIVRSADAEDDFEQIIPKLLAEKDYLAFCRSSFDPSAIR